MQEYLGTSDVDDYSSELEDDMSWVEWYCTIKRHDYFVEVDDDYIRDEFNLAGISRPANHCSIYLLVKSNYE